MTLHVIDIGGIKTYCNDDGLKYFEELVKKEIEEQVKKDFIKKAEKPVYTSLPENVAHKVFRDVFGDVK